VSWDSWEPVLEAGGRDPVLGEGAVRSGTVTRQGSLVVAEFFVRFGEGADPGAGPYLLVPPVPPRAIDELPRRVGSGTLGDQSDGVRHVHVAITANAVIDASRFLLSTDGRPSDGQLIVGGDWPWVWGPEDFLVGLLTYEAAG
jgi:hypothetical protein